MTINVEEYYRQFGPMVMRRCRSMLKDEQLAADAMQDVFVQLLLHEHRLKDQAPSSLLYRMATNVCLNKLRSQKRKPETKDEQLLQQIADLSDAEERSLASTILKRIFGKEQTSTGTIAVMHLLDGLTLEEVAQEVGLSVSGVRKRLRTLKTKVQSQELLQEAS